jgi:hypothetical protein
MTRLEYLNELLPIIYPKFYTAHTSCGYELVFLDDGNPKNTIDNPDLMPIAKRDGFTDKTACEAVANHVHLFDRLGEKGQCQQLKL